MENGFVCINCGKKVKFSALGTKHRNHCPYCLWSLHMDSEIPGDRGTNCRGAMRPVGLAFKSEGGKKQGELEIVSFCERCGFLGKNRLAGDDDVNKIIDVYRKSLEEDKNIEGEISLLKRGDAREIMVQLFGKPRAEEKLIEFDFV